MCLTVVCNWRIVFWGQRPRMAVNTRPNELALNLRRRPLTRLLRGVRVRAILGSSPRKLRHDQTAKDRPRAVFLFGRGHAFGRGRVAGRKRRAAPPIAQSGSARAAAAKGTDCHWSPILSSRPTAERCGKRVGPSSLQLLVKAAQACGPRICRREQPLDVEVAVFGAWDRFSAIANTDQIAMGRGPCPRARSDRRDRSTT